MKNSSDTIGNRTRDLPACSIYIYICVCVYIFYIYIYIYIERERERERERPRLVSCGSILKIACEIIISPVFRSTVDVTPHNRLMYIY